MADINDWILQQLVNMSPEEQQDYINKLLFNNGHTTREGTDE